MIRITRTLLLVSLLVVGCTTFGDAPTTPSNTPPTTVPGGTVPADASPVFVDSTDMLLRESFPVQVVLKVAGNLPTPCHEPVWEVEDDGTTISVILGSLADPDVVCIQVLEPFEVFITLGAFESGAREVVLNGEKVGEFSI
jgi:hypothetical protein